MIVVIAALVDLTPEPTQTLVESDLDIFDANAHVLAEEFINVNVATPL
jgi:hypothetical protein